MVRSVSQGARREIRHAVVFAPEGQPMQRDVSKATRGWAVLSTTSNSRGHAGATSLYENSIVAGEWNRVEGAEGALNVTARLKLIHKFRDHPERTASLWRYIKRYELISRTEFRLHWSTALEICEHDIIEAVLFARLGSLVTD